MNQSSDENAIYHDRRPSGIPADPAGPFVSVLTAPGRGAIAIVRAWGAGATLAADAAFRPHRSPRLAESPAGRPRVGRMGAGTGDEVVALIIHEGGRQPEVEIQCHGGPAAVDLVVRSLESAGATPRPVEDWVAARNGSPIRTLAELDLAHAETARSARILLAQANGALDEAIECVSHQMKKQNVNALEFLETLVRYAEVGLRLRHGFRVALAGRPNVGKSRLLNALAGFGRAIVSPTPGTTRDVVTARTAIDGWPVELADTAGLRESADPIEAGGVALARTRHRGADLVLLVLDRSEPLTETDRMLIRSLPDALIVGNKCDLPGSWDPDPTRDGPRVISAETGEGIDALLAEIGRRLVPDPPPEGSAVPFRASQRRGLSRALRLLRGGRPEPARRALDIVSRSRK